MPDGGGQIQPVPGLNPPEVLVDWNGIAPET